MGSEQRQHQVHNCLVALISLLLIDRPSGLRQVLERPPRAVFGCQTTVGAVFLGLQSISHIRGALAKCLSNIPSAHHPLLPSLPSAATSPAHLTPPSPSPPPPVPRRMPACPRSPARLPSLTCPPALAHLPACCSTLPATCRLDLSP
ncbi:hypothetical protein M3J09_002098 [Ascochyta lentis]